MRTSRCSVRAVFPALLLFTALAFALPQAAMGAVPGISGTVIDEDSGSAITTGVFVDVYVWDDMYQEWTPNDSAYTDEFGYFSISLDPGEYRVGFWDPLDAYVPEFWIDTPYDFGYGVYNAQSISVVSDMVNIDPQLGLAASISGTVTEEGSSDPVQDIAVSVYYYDDDWGEWSWLNEDYTDPDGIYGIAGLPPDTYHVEFYDYSGRYLPEYWDNVSWDSGGVDVASDITLTGGEERSGIDAALTLGGVVAGTVLGDDSGEPVGEIDVGAYRYDSGTAEWYWVDEDWTDVDGEYAIEQLAAGTYRVEFYDEYDRYLPEFYDDVEWDWGDGIWNGTDVAVSAGATSTVSASLAPVPTGAISGTVRDEDTSDPITTVWVEAYAYDGDAGEWTLVRDDYTDGSGAYSIGMLPDATYHLYAYDDYGDYLGEWHADAGIPEEATDVVVSGGAETSGVDIYLALLGPDGFESDDDSASANAIAPDSAAQLHTLFPEGDWDWVYFEAAPNATYVIQTSDPGSGSVDTYMYLYDSDGETQLAANDDAHGLWSRIVWTNGSEANRYYVKIRGYSSDVTGAYFLTVSEVGVGAIGGVLTADGTGVPLEGIGVDLYDASYEGWDWVDYAYSDESGAYAFPELIEGRYYLWFYDEAGMYIGEAYDNKTDLETADEVLVPADGTAVANASLALAGHITGTVTDEDTFGPVADILVLAYRLSPKGWLEWADAWTDETGGYSIDGLTDGTYRLEFIDDWGVGYLGEYYDDADALANATDIAVLAGQTIPGIDAALAPAASISGTVTDGTRGIPDIEVLVYVEGEPEPEYVGSSWTDEDGAYSLRSLPEGTYLVEFADGWYDFQRYYTEWYDDALGWETAAPLALVEGEQVTGIDAALASTNSWGSILGTVSDDTSAPVGDTEVVLWNWDTFALEWISWDTQWTDAEGAYEFRWVPNGLYTVGAPVEEGSPWYGAFVDTYHTSAYGLETADVFEIEGGFAVADIVMRAAEGAARVFGTVTGPSDEPLVGVPVMLFDSGWQYLSTIYTGDSGAYSRAVAAGDYYVYFDGQDDYISEWFDDVPTSGEPWGAVPDDASLVTVYSGGSTEANASLGAASHITGTVTDDNTDLPIEGALVTAYFFDGDDWVFAASDGTDAEGGYDLGGLESNTDFKIEFRGGYGYGAEWSADKPARDCANSITTPMLAGTVAGVDATLGESASITGRVSFDDGDKPEGVQVEMWVQCGGGWYIAQSSYASMWDAYDYGRVDLKGDETYMLKFVDETGPYGMLFYDSAIAMDEADSRLVAAGGDWIANQTLDMLPPSVSSDAEAMYSGAASIKIDAVDAVVGVASVGYRFNEGPEFETAGSSATAYLSLAGDHQIEFWATDRLGHRSPTQTAEFSVTAVPYTPVPVAGATRFGTSALISAKAFPTGLDPAGPRTVVIATGRNWPDALGGSALAGALDGPILLVETNSVPAEITAEITRLGADKAIILGGLAAVGADVETALKTQLGAMDVERIAGGNRYTTADMIAARTKTELGGDWDGTAFVATGLKFADALAAAPLSAGLHWPLYLSNPSSGLSDATKAEMADSDRVVILGGIAAVPDSVETYLNGVFLDANVDRLAGADRYDTAVKVAQYGVDAGLHWDGVAVATGVNYPDALSGGVLQGRDGSVMVLTPTAELSSWVAAKFEAVKDQINEVRFLGGPNAVSLDVRAAVEAILE